MKTYRGSCHCGDVRFEVDLDLSGGSSKCNCTVCTKTRNWGVNCQPEHFRLLTDEERLTDYQVTPGSPNRFPFCKRCGVRTFGHGYVEEIGGAFISVRLACLDEVSPEELVAAPVTYCDGRNDNWRKTPTETRHL